jgi:hypothetical protein
MRTKSDYLYKNRNLICKKHKVVSIKSNEKYFNFKLYNKLDFFCLISMIFLL